MSDSEVVVRSGRKMAVGSDWWEIRDSGVPVTYVDVLTEFRNHNSVVYLSLGQAIIDANNAPLVQIIARHRFDLGTAQNLHRLLGEMIADMTKPVDKSLTN